MPQNLAERGRTQKTNGKDQENKEHKRTDQNSFLQQLKQRAFTIPVYRPLTSKEWTNYYAYILSQNSVFPLK